MHARTFSPIILPYFFIPAILSCLIHKLPNITYEKRLPTYLTAHFRRRTSTLPKTTLFIHARILSFSSSKYAQLLTCKHAYIHAFATHRASSKFQSSPRARTHTQRAARISRFLTYTPLSRSVPASRDWPRGVQSLAAMTGAKPPPPPPPSSSLFCL